MVPAHYRALGATASSWDEVPLKGFCLFRTVFTALHTVGPSVYSVQRLLNTVQNVQQLFRKQCAALKVHRMSFSSRRREGAGGALDPDIPNLAPDIANR
jgi:hypothetical protein